MYTRFGILRNLLATSGVIDMAERHGAYWLLDAIASYQSDKLDKSCDGFQVWTLSRMEENGCVLECRRDSGLPALVRQEIEYTDFPLDSGPFTLWVEGDREFKVILLPSEH